MQKRIMIQWFDMGKSVSQWMAWIGCFALSVAAMYGKPLAYAPAPLDNPMKGLVPYQGSAGTNFPCSMEFNYLPLKAVVTGPERYDWKALEKLLAEVAERGRQTVFRFYLDYPGKPCAVPDYLVQEGVRITEWHSENTYSAKCYSPDYSDPRLQACLTNFIAALGRKYDGDPRIACITAGLLGSWGEWHTYPRNDLWAPNEVQEVVLNAYERAFNTTRILLRYPAGKGDSQHCPNAQRRMGYHDDSFAYATIADSANGNQWYFMNLIAQAGAIDKWKSQPIGGEVRPEVWGCCFDEPGCEPKGQEFGRCVEQTHVTWLMDSGAFAKPMTPQRLTKASALVRRMGYEFFISDADVGLAPDKTVTVALTIENKGVAPFYYQWPFELGALAENGNFAAIAKTDWKITDIPSGSCVRWQFSGLTGLRPGRYKILLRVVNPMPGGRPIYFANSAQNLNKSGWITLGEVSFQPR